jgi:ATP-dependent helicase/nuclease subunit B
LRRAYALRRSERGYRDPRPRGALSEDDWDLGAALLDALEAAFAGFTPEAVGPGRIDLVRLAERHAEALAALRTPANQPDSGPLSQGERDRVRGGPSPERALPLTPTLSPPGRGGTAGLEDNEAAADSEALDQLFDDLALTVVEDGAGRSLDGRFSDYPAFFTALARDRSLAPEPRATHRRVKILGLLEARLLHVDRAVLGGLDEGVWPPVVQSDAFLNRPMRLKLGLTPPERRVGQTAHDFAQLLAGPDVIVTRAAKREGKPMVPSRFLARLRAFAGDAAWSAMVAGGQRYRAMAAAIDASRPVKPIARPAPQPGAAAFPRRLSVTEIETLVRDPYAIYARHVLGLDPLEPLAAAPGAADLGNLFHDVLGGFGAAHPGELGVGSADDLLQRGLDAFRPYEEAYPELYALWWPRFERFVPDYLAWEAERRGNLRAVHVERSGVLELPLGDGVFTLRARADRIEFGQDGGAAIIDYKTGTVPTAKVVAVGFSPQLTLEAAMLMRGGFRDLPGANALPDLHYVRIGARQPLDDTILKAPRGETRNMDQIVADHLAGLEALVRRYGVEGAGYLSRPYPQYARKYAPYDHLARVKEWSVTNGGGEGE